MRKFRRQTALFGAGIISLSLLAGCGENQAGVDTKGENPAADTENAEKRMGRYLEKEIAVPEEITAAVSYPALYLQKSESDELVLAEPMAGRYISADMGSEWEPMDCPWQDMIPSGYISDVALSPDGGVAMVYSPYEEEDGKEPDTSGDKTGEEIGASGDEAFQSAEPEPSGKEGAQTAADEDERTEDTGENTIESVWKAVYFDADGRGIELDFPETGDARVRKLVFDRQGGLYAFDFQGRVYRIDPAAGTKRELFDTEGLMDFVCFTERYMVGFTSRGEVVIYDLEQEKPAPEDRTLQDFVSENLGDTLGSMERGHELVAAGGEQEDIIYFAFSGGVYRHVIGGTAIEQIIDGTISSFGDPSMILMDMVMLPDNEFVVLYNDVRLYRYTYDPNVPAVPEKQVKVYSLVENYSMRQAVSLFQKMHQDVYVHYEIGMSGIDGVTKEDAIRNLNTKIMSGEGPDILLLDGLPRESYEEKGILADMSAVVDGMSGEEELFPNVVEACRKEGAIYGLPIRIQLPMMAGSNKYVEKIKDIETLADAVEEIREENPEGAILGMKSEEELLYMLGLTSSAAWTNEKGMIDEKALQEFLAAAERIWQAELSGVDAGQMRERVSYSDRFIGEDGYRSVLSTNVIGIATGGQEFAIGKVYRVDFDYDVMTSIAELAEDDFGFGFWNGQVSKGFIPDGLAGVAASSADNEMAVEFYRFLFGRDLQDMDLSGGLPVNMASFDSFAKNPREGAIGGDEDLAGGLAMSNDDGSYFELDVKWPKEEEFQRLKEMAGSATRISTGDGAVEEAVYEIGPDALNGIITPEEAVREIVEKSAIYMAE